MLNIRKRVQVKCQKRNKLKATQTPFMFQVIMYYGVGTYWEMIC